MNPLLKIEMWAPRRPLCKLQFMGTLIDLRVGNLVVDWGKNELYTDHLSLFQERDVCLMLSAELEDGTTRMERKLARRLKEVVPRLRLLGHTLESAKDEYGSLIESFGHDESPSFDDLLRHFLKVDITGMPAEYEDDHSFGEFFREEIGPRVHIEDLFKTREGSWDFAYLMENFHPWSVLTMLAENPANQNHLVVWDYSEHLESGWSKEEDFKPSLKQHARFLVVTEGSSDSKVISRAFEFLKPAVADFFYFIDMEEGYPFSGSGNLASFCRGLMKIGIQNKTLIIFDNDAEGMSKQHALSESSRPSNLAIMRLPDLPQLASVSTLGPSGASIDNINGKAASIEAYLDLTWNVSRPAVVRWTNFVESQGVYQGALESKTHYVRQFLDLRGENASYDMSKLEIVLNTILETAESIARLNSVTGR
jgi:hypothetical protein